MKKAIIVHGWDFNPTMHWYPWLKKELESKGYEVIVPEMPNTSEPIIQNWVEHFAQCAGTIDNETVLIGHSIGCQTIMRYLARLPKETQVGKIIFVAGWFKLTNLEDDDVERIAKPWLETPIDLAKVSQKTKSITVFLSNNDPYDCVEENARLFKEKLDAKAIIEKNKGHYTQEDEVIQVPQVLTQVIKE
jgi:predicted alpha/beta hydrolase family esterase